MPIHIPPITRRQFLRNAIATGASLLLPRGLWADEKPADPNTWALLSDTHVAGDRAKVAREVNLAEHFETVVREVVALPQRPAAALVTGDCAFAKGEKSDYATFAELAQPIRAAQIPLHLVPGNHDDRSHLRAAFAEAKATRRPSADRCISMVRSPHANWFLLDSLDKVNSTPGMLGETQLAWLAQTLDANADKPAIVAAHHNPDNREKPGGLLDTAKLLEVILPRKQVKAYIFGHTHVWKVAQHDSGIHFINLPPTAYVFSKGMPSGWVLATLKPDGARLRLHCADRAHAQHGNTVELKWRTS
jgi:predicted phosphodiesterase